MARTDTLGNFLTDVADAIRTKKGTEETILASDFDTEIESLPSGGESGIYKRETVAQMNAIVNPSIGDVCVVGEVEESNLSTTSIFSKATIPASFTVSPTTATQKSVTFRNANNTEYIKIDLKLFGNDTLTIQTANSSKTILFTKSGGNRTRTDSNEDETFTFSTPLYLESTLTWDDRMSYYVLVDNFVSSGIYNYNGTAWVYCDIGTDVNADDIYKNKNAYTNNGLITGTLGIVAIKNDLKKVMTLVDEIDTSNLQDFSYLFEKTSTTAFTTTILPLLDTSSATNLQYMFNKVTSTYLDLSHFDTTNVTNAQAMFYQCTNLQKVDMRSFDFTSISNYTNLFGASASNGVPDNCEIIVADNTQKTWVTTNFSRLTNVKTVAEYEAS